MSANDTFEAFLVGQIEAVTGLTGPAFDVIRGPVPPSRIDPHYRAASVRTLSGDATDLDFGHSDWTESYAVTLYWSTGTALTREERLADAAAVGDSIMLPATVDWADNIYRYWVDAYSWGEAHDAAVYTCTIGVSTKRYE